MKALLFSFKLKPSMVSHVFCLKLTFYEAVKTRFYDPLAFHKS